MEGKNEGIRGRGGQDYSKRRTEGRTLSVYGGKEGAKKKKRREGHRGKEGGWKEREGGWKESEGREREKMMGEENILKTTRVGGRGR